MLDVSDGGSRHAGQVELVRPGSGTDAGERGALDGRRIEVLGCPIDALDMRATVRKCLELIEQGHGARQVSVNAAKLARLSEDSESATYIRGCDVISADGQSVVWASRILGTPLPGRVSGTDLMMELLEAANQRGLGVFILGGRESVLAEAVRRIRASYPGVRVAGVQHGYFRLEEEAEVARVIRDAAPDLLLVAMSSPKKEHWLKRHAAQLEVPLAMGVGGAIEVFAGVRRRAPVWLQRAGFEWLWRLIQEPRRMWRRYLLGNPHFIWLVIRERMRRGRLSS
jgi:N-acetylglucosaminyldiphosphoundecaprenol N-acetyl-beta-D-mannosaminyltransferase